MASTVLVIEQSVGTSVLILETTACDAHSFHARLKLLTEMYCSRQYLLIDPKKSLWRPQFSC